MSLKLWIARRFAGKKLIELAERTLGRPLGKEEKAMLRNLVNGVIGNKMTTLFGAGTGIALGEGLGWHTPSGGVNWWAVAAAVLATLKGIYSKDAATGSSGLSS